MLLRLLCCNVVAHAQHCSGDAQAVKLPLATVFQG